MAIIHSYRLNTGTLLDRFGNSTTLTGGVFKRTPKGNAIYFDGTNDKFELGSLGNVKAIAFWIKLQSTTEQIFEGDPNAHLIHASSGTLTYPDFDNAFIDNVDTDTIDTGWHCIVVTSTTDVACTDAVVALNDTSYGNLYCAKIIAYSEELTVGERAKLQQDFVNAQPLGKILKPIYPKPTSLENEVGISAAYNFTEAGNNTDISGNGLTDVTTGCMLTLEGKIYDGVDDKSVMGNIGNVRTIAMRIKLDSTTEKILEGAANDLLVHASAGTLTYADYDNAYVDGVDTNTITAGNWTNVVITSTTDVNNTAVTLALNNVTYGDFEISDLRFFSDEKDSTWIINYHNSFASQVMLFNDFSYDGIGNVPYGYQPGTGTYSVQEISSQDSILKHLDIGTKYLNCDSAGTIAILSKQAYGTWEFDIYKGGDANELKVLLAANKATLDADMDTEAIIIDSSEDLALQDYDADAALMTSAASEYTHSTWFGIKLTKEVNADCTLYVKGGSAYNPSEPYTIFNPAFGSNPGSGGVNSDVRYLVLDFDVGDRITNLKLTQGVEQ